MQCGGYCRSDFGAQRDCAATFAADGAHMDRVGEQDDVRVGRWIDPQRSSGESRVAVRTHGKEFAAIAGEWRIQVPAEAAHGRSVWGLLRRRHLFYGYGR